MEDNESKINLPEGFNKQIKIQVQPTNRDAIQLGFFFTIGAITAIGVCVWVSQLVNFLFNL